MCSHWLATKVGTPQGKATGTSFLMPSLQVAPTGGVGTGQSVTLQLGTHPTLCPGRLWLECESGCNAEVEKPRAGNDRSCEDVGKHTVKTSWSLRPWGCYRSQKERREARKASFQQSERWELCAALGKACLTSATKSQISFLLVCKFYYIVSICQQALFASDVLSCVTLNQIILWKVPFAHKWVWRSPSYGDESFRTRTQKWSYTNHFWILCLCYTPQKRPSVAFSYLRETKLLNNMLEGLVTIHLELLETEEQPLNPFSWIQCRAVLWAIM